MKRTFVAALVTGFVFASAALAAEPGVTDTEIVVGQPAGFDGPSSGLGIEMWRGVDAAFRAANDAGGVHGRKVKLVLASDGYDAERAAPAVVKLVAKEKVFAVGFGVGTPTIVKALPVVLKYHNEQDLFYFANFTGAQPQREPPYDKVVFNVRASYRQETKAMVDAYVAMGRKKIGIYVQDDAYGTSGRDGVKRALKDHSLTMFADTTYPRGQTYDVNVDAQVKILKDAGVDAIIAVGAYQACAALVRDARLAGWDVPIHNVSFVGADQMLALLKKEETGGKKVLYNLINTQVVPHYADESVAVVKEYRKAMEKYKSTTPPLKKDGGVFDGSYVPSGSYSFGSLEGYVSAKAFLAVLDAAGKELTRKGFYAAAEKLGKFDLGLGVPAEFSATRHQAVDKVWFTCAASDGWTATSDASSCLKSK
jgi:branched-chain amino acid transport system substrate-binding protein